MPVPEIPDAESLTVEFKSDLVRLSDDDLARYGVVKTGLKSVTP